jgi:hypothetical protein
VFVDDDYTAAAFACWPTLGDGSCLLGYRVNYKTDTAWVRLAMNDASSTSFATTADLGGVPVLVHFDDNSRVVAIAIAEASLHLPPCACVPGAMQNLAIEYSEELDILQVRFSGDRPLGAMEGHRVTVVGDDQLGSALVVVREPCGQVIAVLLEGSQRLLHPTLLAAVS